MNSLLNNLLVLLLAVGSALASPSKLASAEVAATCQLKDISHPMIADLCASVGQPGRYMEFFRCSTMAVTKDSVAHYIFQETYQDKENLSGIKLTGLFKGMGSSTQTTRELIDLVQIDDQVDSLSSIDLAFASHRNNLVFDLMIVQDDFLQGKITDTSAQTVTEVTCIDISTEN